jgi:ABC-2 type transport system permease protein
MWGKGYLSPLGFVALILVFAQLVAAAGYGSYFPWSVPAIFSGAAGDYRLELNIFSFAAVIITGVAGSTTVLKTSSRRRSLLSESGRRN